MVGVDRHVKYALLIFVHKREREKWLGYFERGKKSVGVVSLMKNT